MGIIVKLLGGGLGMASEAVHDYRARSRSRSDLSPSPSAAVPSSSARAPPPDYHAPPAYAEVADEAAAQQLIRTGRAEKVVGYAEQDKSKAAEAGYGHEEDDDDSSSDDEDSDGVGDEAAWELDDMAERLAPAEYADPEPPVEGGESEEAKVRKEEQMVREMVRMAGPPSQPARRLPCPVIVPQRRPRNKDRGFVHAYAPVLQECGVGQDVFLKFLRDWLVASKSDPWIDIVFLSAGVVGFVPEAAAQIVSTVVQVVAGTARELQSRSRRNTFLDRVNQDLFMPRGLYAMVMAFKDQVPGQQPRGPLSKLAGTLGKSLFSAERLDINQTAAKYSNPDPEMSGLKKGMKNLRLASGKTYTELELPEAAALIYPDLDRAVEDDVPGKGKGKGAEKAGVKDNLKGASAWVQDYLDRKAEAAYERDHPGSSLAVPSESRKGFSSRFNDPDHPVNSGSLISFVTGGVVDTGSRRNERRAARQDRKALRREYRDARRTMRGKAPMGPRRARRQKGRKGIVRKILQQDVLYLLIVNLPSDQEVKQSVADLERMMSRESYVAQ